MGLCALECDWLHLWYPSTAWYSFQHQIALIHNHWYKFGRHQATIETDWFECLSFVSSCKRSHIHMLQYSLWQWLSFQVRPSFQGDCCLFLSVNQNKHQFIILKFHNFIGKRNPMSWRCHLYFFCNKMMVIVISCYIFNIF